MSRSEDSGRPLFFLSAGEPSGDLHAAELIKALKQRYPNASFVGCGGELMEKAGCRLIVPLTQVAVMGVGPVLKKLPVFMRYLRQVGTFFEKEKPDATILVDFPGFNWQVAKRAKQAGVPTIYFMPPQLWAWGPWRIKRMKRLIDQILCPLEFEAKWFQSRGCAVEKIGHPFFGEVRHRQLDQRFVDEWRDSRPFGDRAPLLTLLPGSRDQEVHSNLIEMLRAISIVRRTHPELRVLVAAFKESQAQYIRTVLDRYYPDWTRGDGTTKENSKISVFVGRTSELISIADCCFAVSGSVSLELLANRQPTVIYYRLNPISRFLFRFFCRIRYITLTNLIAVDRMANETIFFPDWQKFVRGEPTQHERDLMVYPEFLTGRDQSTDAAAVLSDWLSDSERLRAERQKLDELLRFVDRGDSPIENAVDSIERFLLTRNK